MGEVCEQLTWALSARIPIESTRKMTFDKLLKAADFFKPKT